jgi:hypothetical protein
MKTDQIVMCVVALLLGMLLANMLKNVCGCKIVEGQHEAPDAKQQMLEASTRAAWCATCSRIDTEANCNGAEMKAFGDNCKWTPGGGLGGRGTCSFKDPQQCPEPEHLATLQVREELRSDACLAANVNSTTETQELLDGAPCRKHAHGPDWLQGGKVPFQAYGDPACLCCMENEGGASFGDDLSTYDPENWAEPFTTCSSGPKKCQGESEIYIHNNGCILDPCLGKRGKAHMDCCSGRSSELGLQSVGVSGAACENYNLGR